jgi:hypothetical protein
MPGSMLPGRVPHEQAVEGGKPHRAADAAAVAHRAHAGTAAEVGDDHPAAGNRWRDDWQGAGNVLVGQPVETVAAHTALEVLVRQAVELRDPLLRLVEGGVEAGDLRQIRLYLLHGTDRRQVVRLVQRRQRDEVLESPHRFRRHQQRCRVIGSAMHDAVTDTGQHAALEARAQQSGDPLQGLRMAGDLALVPLFVGDPLAGAILDLEARRGAQPLDLANRGGAHLPSRGERKQRELEARRAGIENQNQLFHLRLLPSASLDPLPHSPSGRRPRTTRAWCAGCRRGW